MTHKHTPPRPLGKLRDIPRCQRWRERKDSYRHIGDNFDPTLYAVDGVSKGEARAFVEAHHYSGSFPAARLSVGLYRAWGVLRSLVGVAVFSVPMQPDAIRAHLGLVPARGVELGRFVLLDEIPGNAESWFLARALRLLRSELSEVEGVLSYSDPMPRNTVQGDLVTPGHVGTIYQASNARYLGRSSSRTLLLGPDGRALSGRSLSKIRLGERGDGVAADRLVALGLPPRAVGEDGAAWVRRALEAGRAAGLVRELWHPGNHVYTFSLNPCSPLGERNPYPKKERQ